MNEMISADKLIASVVTLIRLTRRRELLWSQESAREYFLDAFDPPDEVYVTQYKDRRLALFRMQLCRDFPRPYVERRAFLAFRRSQMPAFTTHLAVVNEQRHVVWKYPALDVVSVLYGAVTDQFSEIYALIEDLAARSSRG